MFPQKESYKYDHFILDHQSHDRDLKDFSFTFVELPKFDVPIDQLQTMTEKWCYFFKYADETREADLDRIVGSDLILKRAYEELNQFSWNEDELHTYEQALKQERDARAIEDAKWEEAKKIEREEGRREGIERGIEQERNKNALLMMQAGVALETVIKITGLSEMEISNLCRLD